MSQNDNERLQREAEQWFARRLDPSDEKRQELERWRAEDPRHAKAYAQTEALWGKLEVLQQSKRLRLAPSDLRTFGRRRPRYRSVWAIGGSIAASLALVLIWWTQRVPVETFTTGIGEQLTETLEDGTIVRLNTDTALKVRIARHLRTVTLTSGEADFDVAKDSARPFVVNAGDGTVTAVGTHFDVRRDGDIIAVTLQEGRVFLARESRQELEWLDPGQQATFSRKISGIVRRNVDPLIVMGWAGGRLEFRATPLREVVAEANRYSVRKIQLGESAIEDLAVSGSFRTGDIDSIAAALEAALGLRAEKINQLIILRSR